MKFNLKTDRAEADSCSSIATFPYSEDFSSSWEHAPYKDCILQLPV